MNHGERETGESNVAAAYTHIVDAYEHIMGRCEFWYGFFLDLGVVRSVQDYRWILHL